VYVCVPSCCPAQVAEAESLLANSTALVVQQLQLPAKACAVITNGRVLWVVDPRDPDNPPPGVCTYMCVHMQAWSVAANYRLWFTLRNVHCTQCGKQTGVVLQSDSQHGCGGCCSKSRRSPCRALHRKVVTDATINL
jgi:hypothetical protein